LGEVGDVGVVLRVELVVLACWLVSELRLGASERTAEVVMTMGCTFGLFFLPVVFDSDSDDRDVDAENVGANSGADAEVASASTVRIGNELSCSFVSIPMLWCGCVIDGDV
jgi:hypothetical protein